MIKIKLGDYLKEKNISINWLHKATGIRYATLINIIYNRHKSVTLQHVYNIMEALNIKDMNLIFEKVDTN